MTAIRGSAIDRFTAYMDLLRRQGRIPGRDGEFRDVMMQDPYTQDPMCRLLMDEANAEQMAQMTHEALAAVGRRHQRVLAKRHAEAVVRSVHVRHQEQMQERRRQLMWDLDDRVGMLRGRMSSAELARDDRFEAAMNLELRKQRVARMERANRLATLRRRAAEIGKAGRAAPADGLSANWIRR